MINHHDVYLIFYVKINLEVMSVKKEQKNRIWAPEQKAEIACNHLFGQCCNRRRTPEARPAAVRAAGGFLPVQLPAGIRGAGRGLSRIPHTVPCSKEVYKVPQSICQRSIIPLRTLKAQYGCYILPPFYHVRCRRICSYKNRPAQMPSHRQNR